MGVYMKAVIVVCVWFFMLSEVEAVQSAIDLDNVFFGCTSADELRTATEVIRDEILMPLESGEEVVEAITLDDETTIEEYTCGLVLGSEFDFERARVVDHMRIYFVEEDAEERRDIYEVDVGGCLMYLTRELPFDRHVLSTATEQLPWGTQSGTCTLARLE